MRTLHGKAAVAASFAALALLTAPARAQQAGWGTPAPAPYGTPAPAPYGTPTPAAGYGAPPAYGTPPAYGAPPGYANPPAAAAPASKDAGVLELGLLYGTAVAYGVGTGIWLDAEFKIEDPGLMFLAPGIAGVAMPIGVYFLDQNSSSTGHMPRGVPAAITAGMTIGAGEAMGFAGYQMVHANEADSWGFRGFARSVFIGSTLGAGAGYAAGVTMEPSPKTSLLAGSSAVWGTIIGSMFGYGASDPEKDWTDTNDSAALGGLIGFNVALAGAAGLSAAYVPTYKSIGWMWAGFGAGFVASTPVYLFYAGSDHSPRRGLIFQGTAELLGVAAGAIFTMNSPDVAQAEPEPVNKAVGFQITGGGMMPVPGGMGLQVSGLLF